ncbi:MAG: EamA family transporter [Pirellulaceae bacterium]
MIERTFAIIKPDGVRRDLVGAVIARAEKAFANMDWEGQRRMAALPVIFRGNTGSRMSMVGLHVGELAAMGTALLWTLSAVAWTAAGRYMGAMVVSLVRLLITCVLLGGYGWITRERLFPTDATLEAWGILGLSGFLGFFLSDLFLFKSLLLIGPRLSLLIFSITPPLAALFAWLLGGEPLAARGWLGMAITLAGVAWVVAERPVPDKLRTDRRPWKGVLFAALAAVWQAGAAVFAQRGIGDYDASAAAHIRVLGGLVGLIPLVTVLGRWPAVYSAVCNLRAMSILVAGSIVGPFLGVILFLVALQHCHAGIVTTITATMPVLILPFSIFLHRERVSFRAALGACISVVGVGLLVW